MENGSSAAHPAGHAIDGAADTYAQAGGTPPDPQVTLPWGLVVDLGQPRLFNTVQFTLDSEHYTRHFVINTSADRINWVRAVSDTIWPYAMDGGGTFAYSFAPREARFVQLSAKLLHGTENHIIRDFKVYLAQSLT